jgi:nitrogen regulatory protein P-II 1
VQLLLAILHREELLDEVLSTLVELEAPDAVVVESRSGLELLERDLPIFAGLRSLIPSGIDFSSLVVCVIEDDRIAEEALAAVSRLEESPRNEGEGVNMVMLIPVSAIRHF